jgi:outer membrane autotransporter protein
MKNITQVMRGLFLIASIFTLSSISQYTVAAESSVSVSCIDPNDINTCQISGNGALSTQLVDLTANLIKTAQTFNDTTPITDPSCYYDSVSNTAICNLNSNGNPNYPIQMSCSNPNGTGTLSCSLDSAPLAFNISCNSNTTIKTCTISTNTQELTNQLDQISSTNPINPNLISLAQSLSSCINRNTFPNSTEGNELLQGPISVAEPGLDNFSLQDICDQFIYQLDNDPDSALALLKSLQPLNPDAPIDLSVANLKLTLSTIQGRLFRLRNGIAEAKSNNFNDQFYVNGEWHESGTLFADNSTSTNDANQSITVDKNISEYGKLGFFINASYLKAKQTNDDFELESNAHSSVLTLGIDYRFTDNVIAGLAFNINQGKTDIDGGFDTSGTMKNDGFSLLFYNSVYIENWFIDSSLSIGGDDYEQQRDPISLNNSYESNFHGDQINLTTATGYNIDIHSFNITPFAQIALGTIDIDGYRETALNPLGPNASATLEIDEQNKDIGTFSAGSYFRYIATTQRGVFIPSLSITLVNDFKDEAQTITGRFVANANPNSSFQLQTNTLDSTYFVIGAGFSFQLKGGNAGFINIESVQGYDNLEQERITAGWRWEI